MRDSNHRIKKNANQIDSSQLPKMAKELHDKSTSNKIRHQNTREKISPVSGRRETQIEKYKRHLRMQKRHNDSLNDSKSPSFHVVDTPSWFTNNNTCDVSIIVPMYRSKAVIKNQINLWDLEDDGLTKEIIYCDDLCPQQSAQHVLSSWEKRRHSLKGIHVGKIIQSHTNRGYGSNCNLGAKFALGKYLIFLNADVTVLPNWIRPMYDLIDKNEDIGLVGNLQLKSETGNIIDSLGSEWNWKNQRFEHIGRSILNGEKLTQPISFNEQSLNDMQPEQREMVTGCCFIISKDLFLKIEGYDESYKIGYWEDSDMNMAVQELNKKVYFTPKSRVIHIGGHSKSGGHEYLPENKKHFLNRWVKTGFVDSICSTPRPKDRKKPIFQNGIKDMIDGEVVGCIIACNEEEFIEASVRSVAPIVDRFIFVIGGNHYAYKAGMCNIKGYPSDNTLEIVKSLAKEFNGEVIEPPSRLWNNKTEMRNAYANKLNPGNWMFMLDGDEVYKTGQLWKVASLMTEYECLRMQYHLFWNNVNTLGIGSWEEYPQERIVKWKHGYHYKNPNHLAVTAANGVEVAQQVPTYNGSDKLFYHYSWVRPLEKIKQKMRYYQIQLANEWQRIGEVNDNYFDDVFLKWRTNPNSISYTHPRGGGSYCEFGGIHPYEVTKLIDAGKLNFND